MLKLALTCFLFSHLAWAQNTATKTVNLSELGKVNVSKVQPQAPVPSKKKEGLKVEGVCRNTQGIELKAGDTGYEACMATYQDQLRRNKTDRANDVGNSFQIKVGN